MLKTLGPLLFLSILFIFNEVRMSEATTVSYTKNQNVTIQRLTNRLCNFLTYAQYANLSNTIMADLLAGQTIDEIKAEAMAMVTAVLTTAQYSTALSKATTLIFTMGASGITTALTTFETVMANNLTPFFNQMVNYTSTLQAQGMKTSGVEKNVYRIVNSFMTKKRITTIFTRVSLQFSSSQWSALTSALDGIINFSANGF